MSITGDSLSRHGIKLSAIVGDPLKFILISLAWSFLLKERERERERERMREVERMKNEEAMEILPFCWSFYNCT